MFETLLKLSLKEEINKIIADDALKMLDIDLIGLDLMDRSFLLAIIEKFSGGPVGLII